MFKQLLSGFGFLSGASYPFRALALFQRHPRLWTYLVVPILVNVILGVGFYVELLLLGWNLSQQWLLDWAIWVDQAIASLPPWLGFLEAVLVGLASGVRVLAWGLLLIVTGFILAQFGVLLGAPWYGKLSEQLEKIKTGEALTLEVGIVRDLGRAILFELKKLLLLIGIGLPLLILNFVAGIGTLISTIGGLTLTTTLVCLDFLDSPLERRRLKFRQKLGIIYRNLPATAGFSLVCLFLISIPLLNLVTIPLCLAGGTLFFCDRIYPSLAQSGKFPQGGNTQK
jgi:CysZ protein